MKVVCIDARNALYRYAHTGRNLHARSGQDTGAVHGLLQGMLAIKKRMPDAKFVVVWDGKDADKSWRHRIFPEYKANRKVKPSPELVALRASVNSQIGIVRELFDGIDVCQADVNELEADDLVAMIAYGVAIDHGEAFIYSSDQDYHQMLAHGVGILTGATDPPLRGVDVRRKWGVELGSILKLRALLGDKSDGIPRAVPGVGPVSGRKYILGGVDPAEPNFGDLPRHVRFDCPRVGQYWPVVHRNWQLMRLVMVPEDGRLNAAESAAAAAEVERVGWVLGRPVQRDVAAYERVLRRFAELDLSVAIENRAAIWNLQTVPKT